LTKQQLLTQQDIDKLQQAINRQATLAHQFALVPIREMLESNHRYAIAQLDEQTTLVQQASSCPLATIQRDHAQYQRELAQTERERIFTRR